MLKKVIVVGALFVACLSTKAIAAEGPYLGANVGVSMTSDSDLESGGDTAELSYDTGLALGAALGYNFGAGRIEGEIGYKTADTDKVSVDGLGSASIDGDVSVLSLLVNGYVDFNAATAVKPYIMAGVGMANIEVELEGEEKDDTVFAYQAGVGVGFMLNDKVALDLSYRYMGTSDPEFDGVDAEYGSHNLLAGIRFQF